MCATHSKPVSSARIRARDLVFKGRAIKPDRRSQLYLSDSVSASASNTDDEFDYYDRGSVIDEENDVEGQDAFPEAVEYDPHAVVGNLQWDEDLITPGPSSTAADSPGGQRTFLVPQRPRRHPTQDTVVPRPIVSVSAPREDTPLLPKQTSLTFAEPPRPSAGGGDVLPAIAMPIEGPPQTLTRRTSQVSVRSRRGSTASKQTKAVQAGQSTFGQTVSSLNVVAFHHLSVYVVSCSMLLQSCLELACCPNPWHLHMQDG